MAPLEKAFAVGLTIPDNESFTALAALRRLGLPVGGLRRADIWTFDVDPVAAATIEATIATVETIFNPNKHELRERPGSHPAAGEVWIAPLQERVHSNVGGRTIPGVRGVRRCVGWQLLDANGTVADSALIERAVETFLCNPAFQRAIRW
jgi:phosphoribosylformylglycinamidine (FGAM) synthase PurS component